MLLTALTFSPFLGVLAVALIGRGRPKATRWVAVAAATVPLALALLVAAKFHPGASGMQMSVRLPWVPEVGIWYSMGVDGVSLPMVFLSALLSFLAVVASWKVEVKPMEYFSLLFMLEAGLIGVFLALDFVLFYLFWEVVLIPMYFLITIWGGPRREYAALKFFIYTLAGSLILLVGIIVLYFQAPERTFEILALSGRGFPLRVQYFVMACLFLGFAVKVPIFPLHTWLPDAHVEAPTAVSVLLAGVLLKMGAYGFIRVIIPITPDAWRAFAPFVSSVAAINIVYGALLAIMQTDLKKLVAYSSVSHMGYVMLGIAAGTSAALSGAMLQMFSHGLITGMLFLLVGLIYERTHTRQMPELGGLAGNMPKIAGVLAFAAFASLGLPGLSGFVAEFLILLGSWPVAMWATTAAAAGVVVTAAYLLWMLQRVIFGPAVEKYAGLVDADGRELWTLAPLMGLTLVVGFVPSLVLKVISPAAVAVSKIIGS